MVWTRSLFHLSFSRPQTCSSNHLQFTACTFYSIEFSSKFQHNALWNLSMLHVACVSYLTDLCQRWDTQTTNQLSEISLHDWKTKYIFFGGKANHWYHWFVHEDGGEAGAVLQWAVYNQRIHGSWCPIFVSHIPSHNFVFFLPSVFKIPFMVRTAGPWLKSVSQCVRSWLMWVRF